tara:strand:+ start:287 stop:508 length:222 start_codon:yes stop_codon:yes gene_type:complete
VEVQVVVGQVHLVIRLVLTVGVAAALETMPLRVKVRTGKVMMAALLVAILWALEVAQVPLHLVLLEAKEWQIA